VPQQSASKTARIWGPVLKYLTKETGYKFKLKTAKNIPVFENRLLNAEADFSYMNPYHYTIFHEKSEYQALAKAKDKRIKGIIVVHKDSNITSIEDLKNKDLAFPSPAAFAASILPRGYLKQQNITIIPHYVSSHDSVYQNVAKNKYIAGGGIMRTFKNVNKKIRKQLKVLWTTEGYTPHAIAYHSRVPKDIIENVQTALIKLEETKVGKDILKKIKIKGFEKAFNEDWNDVRLLKIDQL